MASPQFTGLDCTLIRFSVGNDAELGRISFVYTDDSYETDDFASLPSFSLVDSVGMLCVQMTMFLVEPFKLIYRLECRNMPTLPATSSSKHEFCWDLISSWMTECNSSHRDCASPHPYWSPTRLIDVRDYERGLVHLIDTAGKSERSMPYVALSHCWGKKHFKIMNQSNKRDFEAGFAVEDLPPNFQDALYATKRLGFRYIWIDSLCIIQGSDDWKTQAPLMNKVYRNSSLTLAATASPDAYGGLFRDRDPYDIIPPELEIPMGMKGRVENVKCSVIPMRLWASEVRNGPLNKRAWVVQERLLAPRTVHFCNQQIFWECCQLEACEVFPQGIPKHFFEDYEATYELQGFKNWERAVRSIRTGGEKDSRLPEYQSPYELWQFILSEYMACGLTNPGDKFVALSGIAKEFSRVLQDEYVAGLWRGDFINCLLWYVNDRALLGDAPDVKRPESYRSPSWSWASIDGSVTHPIVFELSGDYAEILDVSIEPSGGDLVGGLRRAQITACGRLIQISRPTHFNWNSMHYFGTFHPDVREEIVDTTYFCLPLRELGVDGPYHSLWGLVIVPASSDTRQDTHPRTFKRVGIFRIDTGEPLEHLTQRKPEGWKDIEDTAWFDEDTPMSEFLLI